METEPLDIYGPRGTESFQLTRELSALMLHHTQYQLTLTPEQMATIWYQTYQPLPQGDGQNLIDWAYDLVMTMKELRIANDYPNIPTDSENEHLYAFAAKTAAKFQEILLEVIQSTDDSPAITVYLKERPCSPQSIIRCHDFLEATLDPGWAFSTREVFRVDLPKHSNYLIISPSLHATLDNKSVLIVPGLNLIFHEATTILIQEVSYPDFRQVSRGNAIGQVYDLGTPNLEMKSFGYLLTYRPA